VRAPVSLVDVAPTVLDHLGLRPLARASGRSILPLLRGENAEPVAIRASLSIYQSLESVVLGDVKYIYDPEVPDRQWLFDLASDPAERQNLAPTRPLDAARMRGLLDESIRLAEEDRIETVTVELDDERAAQLRSLGYLP
jgi:arylsulfatase A-like enzyme